MIPDIIIDLQKQIMPETTTRINIVLFKNYLIFETLGR